MPTPNNLRAKTGYWMERLGLLGLPLGIGSLIGFYMADQEMRLIPEFLSIVVIFLAFSLISILLGRVFAKQLYQESQQQKKARKRVIACITALLLLAGIKLLLYWTEQPSGLTRLTPAEFNDRFAYDARLFEELDLGLENAVRFLHTKEATFKSDRVLTASEEQLLKQAWSSIWDMAFALDQIRFFYEDWYRYDISRIERHYHLKSFLLTYAAELVLYEKGSRIIKLIKDNPNAVKFLDSSKADWDLPENSFAHFRAAIQGERDQARVIAGKQYLEFLKVGVKGFQEAKTLGCDWLWERAEESISAIEAMSHFKLAVMGVSSDLSLIKTSLKRNWYPTQSRVAEWMGDTRVRRVGSPLITRRQLAEMEKALEPGDLLLSRHNWYLSNIGLPGFWPHSAIYIGNPDRLDAYFDDITVRNFIRARSGKDQSVTEYLSGVAAKEWWIYTERKNREPFVILEAISEGVTLSTMNDLQADYLAALRPQLSKLDKLKAILEAFTHVGKPYDFNFDFATDHALVCTELLWRSYRPGAVKTGLDIPLITVMGRQTLPANQIAALYAEEQESGKNQLRFVYFLDGREKQKSAVVAGEEAFRGSHLRTKWDVFLE